LNPHGCPPGPKPGASTIPPSSRTTTNQNRTKKLGWVKGFEPSTSASTEQRSNRLSYTHQTNHPFRRLRDSSQQSPQCQGRSIPSNSRLHFRFSASLLDPIHAPCGLGRSKSDISARVTMSLLPLVGNFLGKNSKKFREILKFRPKTRVAGAENVAP
jgi:hypothetical protein